MLVVDWLRGAIARHILLSKSISATGPIRCSIAASGTHRGENGREFFRYIVRIHACVGQPYVRIEHIFSNEQHPYATVMTGGGIRLPLRPTAFRAVPGFSTDHST